MRLGFGQLATVLTAMHPGVDRRIVEARLKYFQRMSFPPTVVKAGSGGRADYELPDVVMLLVVFELLAAGVAPLLAASTVGADRSKVETGVAEAWSARAIKGETFFLVHPDGFEAKRGADGELFVGEALQIEVWKGNVGARGRRVVIVDARLMMRELDKAFGALPADAPLNPVRARAGLDDWAEGRLATVAAAEPKTGT